MNRATLSLIAANIILVSCIDLDTGKMMNDELYELPQNCDFSKVEGNSEFEYECSPKLKDGILSEFDGLLINGPQLVVWPKEVDLAGSRETRAGDDVDSPLRLMVAGLVSLPTNTLGLNGRFNDRVVIVAVNQDTAEVYSGKLQAFGSLPDPEPMPSLLGGSQTGSPEEDMASNTSLAGTWFGIDLTNNLGIPIKCATYTVYATLGDYKSNILTIETRLK